MEISFGEEVGLGMDSLLGVLFCTQLGSKVQEALKRVLGEVISEELGQAFDQALGKQFTIHFN